MTVYRATKSRQGFGTAVILVLVFLGLMAAMASITSQRSKDVRRQAADSYLGRHAEHIARSAIEEALASLSADDVFGTGRLDAQGRLNGTFLASLDASHRVKRDDHGRPVSIDFPDSMKRVMKADITAAMAAADPTVQDVGDVRVQTVSFSAPNQGLVRLEAKVSLLADGLHLERTVVEEHQFAIDLGHDSRLRFDPISSRRLVIRGSATSSHPRKV